MKYLIVISIFINAKILFAELSDVSVKSGYQMCATDYGSQKEYCMSYNQYRKNGGTLKKKELRPYIGKASVYDWDDESIDSGVAESLNYAMGSYHLDAAKTSYDRVVDSNNKELREIKKRINKAQKKLNKSTKDFTKAERNNQVWIDSSWSDVDANSAEKGTHDYLNKARVTKAASEILHEDALRLANLKRLQANKKKEMEAAARAKKEKEKKAYLAAKKKKEDARAATIKKEAEADRRSIFASRLRGQDVETKLDEFIDKASDLSDRAKQASEYYNDTLMGLFVRMKLQAIEDNFCDAKKMCDDGKKADLKLNKIFKSSKNNSRWNKFKSFK